MRFLLFAFLISITRVYSDSFVYVTNEADNSISVVNATVFPNKTVQTITSELFNTPVDIAVSPDRKYAYVLNSPSSGNGSVCIIDIAANNQVLDLAIPVGTTPLEIVILPNGKYAYISNSTSCNISVIELASNSMTTIGGIAGPSGLAATSDSKSVYVIYNGFSNGVIGKIDVESQSTTSFMNLDYFAHAIVLTLNEEKAYVVTNDSYFYVVDLVNNLPGSPFLIPGAGSLQFIAIEPIR